MLTDSRCSRSCFIRVLWTTAQKRRNAPAHRAACYCRDMAENESPKPRFLLTPQQHRRRAQDMREAGRPDLAEHLEKLALAIERAQSQQKSPTE
jgi:hypothetical protein